jgi:hypothetical protein
MIRGCFFPNNAWRNDGRLSRNAQRVGRVLLSGGEAKVGDIDRCVNMTGGGADARALAAKMSEAWIAFARKGDPNHPGLPKWPAFTADRGATMIFDNECEVKNDPDGPERRTVTTA